MLGKSWELFLEATKSVGQSEGLEACHLSSCHSYIQCTVSVFLMIGIAHVKCVDLYIFLSIYGLCSDINTQTAKLNCVKIHVKTQVRTHL